jgi:hypothetical protein
VTRWGDRAYAEPSETSSAFYWLVYRVLQALRYEGEPLFDEEEGKEGEEVGRAGSRLAGGLRVLAGAECVQSSNRLFYRRLAENNLPLPLPSLFSFFPSPSFPSWSLETLCYS